MQDIHFIEQADEAAEILKPVRIDILTHLAEPATCPELAKQLGLTTQKINYHMNVLKKAGLVKLVDERRKRGTVEGVYQAVARTFCLSPQLVRDLGGSERTQDQASLSYLLQIAEDLQIDVGSLLRRETELRSPSLGVDAHIQLREDSDRAQFLEEVQTFFTDLAERYGSRDGADSEDGGRFRLMLACYQEPDNDEIDHRRQKEKRDGGA